MSKNKEYPVLDQEQPKKSDKDQRTESNRGQCNTQVKGKNEKNKKIDGLQKLLHHTQKFHSKLNKDHEKIISIQGKIIKTQEQTIKKEKIISDLLYDKYLDVMVDNGNWKYCYEKLNKKWVAAGIYARDRTAYMREYMKKKRANGEIKHWRKYKEEKIMKGKNVEKKKTKYKKDTRGIKTN